MHANHVVCFGLPKMGALAALPKGELLLVDVGLPRLVFKRLGMFYASPFWDASAVRLEQAP